MPALATTSDLSNRLRPFSRKEAASIAGVSVDTIDEAIHQNRFPVLRPSGDASSITYDTLHWDGDELVFQTNSSGKVDDIKIGTSGDITPLDPSFGGLTFWDRGPANTQTGSTIYFCHNVNGTGNWLGNTTAGATNAGCSGIAPTSFLWTSTAFTTHPSTSAPTHQTGVGQGSLLGLARADGLTDGLNTLQGVRTMDSSAGTWTTPDAYAGEVDDPASQKSYMWNNNNPVGYSDPTGYDALFYDAEYGPQPDDGHAVVFGQHQTDYDGTYRVDGVYFMLAGVGTSLPDAVEGTARANHADAIGNHREDGAPVYCLFGSSGCFTGGVQHSETCQSGQDCNVDAGANPALKSFFVGYWHEHPAGSQEDSLSEHMTQLRGMADSLGIDAHKQPLYMWTTLGHNIETQRFTGNPFVPGDGLIGNLCTGCIP